MAAAAAAARWNCNNLSLSEGFLAGCLAQSPYKYKQCSGGGGLSTVALDVSGVSLADIKREPFSSDCFLERGRARARVFRVAFRQGSGISTNSAFLLSFFRAEISRTEDRRKPHDQTAAVFTINFNRYCNLNSTDPIGETPR